MIRLIRAAALLALALGSFAPPALASGGAASTPAPSMTSMPAEHLQAMIDAAEPGATLIVPKALYQGRIVIDTALTLQGQGMPVIDGGGRGSVITVHAADVTITGLMVHNSGQGPLGAPSGIILAHADRAHITGVQIMECYFGITVRASTDVLIEHNQIYGRKNAAITGEMHAVSDNSSMAGMPGMGGSPSPATPPAGSLGQQLLRGDGIWLWNTRTPVVRDNLIQDVRDGVYLTYGVEPLLEGNRIAGGRYAVHDMYATGLTLRGNSITGNLSGFVLMYGGPILVDANTIMESGSPSTGFGILVKDAGGVQITRNVIADNRVGMHLDDAGRTTGGPMTVSSNTIAMNQLGILIYPGTGATFTENSFVENSTQVTLGGEGSTGSAWSLGGVGNYWSDYGGFDANGDGVGDLPYTQSGRVSQLLQQDPELIALVSGPAFRLLSSVQDKWSPANPLVTDGHPLMSSRSPALAGGHAGSGVPLWIPGLLMTAGCGWLLFHSRRPGGKGRRLAHA